MDLIQELRGRGFHVPNTNRPLTEVETHRLGVFINGLLEGQSEKIANSLGVGERTLTNWKSNPGSISRAKAEALIDCLTQFAASKYGVNAEIGREAVLTFITDRGESKRETARSKAIGILLAYAQDFLFDEELEGICRYIALTVAHERQGQTSQQGLKEYLEVAESWLEADKKAPNDENQRLENAVQRFRETSLERV